MQSRYVRKEQGPKVSMQDEEPYRPLIELPTEDEPVTLPFPPGYAPAGFEPQLALGQVPAVTDAEMLAAVFGEPEPPEQVLRVTQETPQNQPIPIPQFNAPTPREQKQNRESRRQQQQEKKKGKQYRPVETRIPPATTPTAPRTEEPPSTNGGLDQILSLLNQMNNRLNKVETRSTGGTGAVRKQ